ncbi:MAG: zinc ribbon domain-containing protein [Coriobacteriia bacterium]|nr:zinc ribbon domain-containing protein [Coriobacteriia bacterium]MBS5479084.1 zinc ribbon domain-containing protein [Coriobacteriia bacterium]
MASNFGSNFAEKYRNFMSHRNGPDQLSRDLLILAIIVIIISVFLKDAARGIVLFIGIVVLGYSYFRLFSGNIAARSRENEAYIAKRNQIFGKFHGPLGKAQAAGEKAKAAGAKAARQAKDKDHRYFACPKCGQQVRVPKGAGKIRVTCPKCGEKFERKA